MWYVVQIAFKTFGIQYRLYDTNTEASMMVDINFIINYGIKLENADIVGNNLEMKEYWRDIKKTGNTPDDSTGKNYICIGKCSTGMYKCVDFNGRPTYMNEFDLEHTITKAITNSKDVNNNEFIGTHDIDSTSEFAMSIHDKYDKFIAKTKLLGHSMDFRYKIENDNVILTTYIGESPKPIIPNFITSIGEGAFDDTETYDIILNEGLRFIGGFAFARCKISHIVIPETVEYIGKDAFTGCRKMYDTFDNLKKSSIELKNKDTVIFIDIYK